MNKSYTSVKKGKKSSFDNVDWTRFVRLITRDSDITGNPIGDLTGPTIHVVVPVGFGRYEHLTVPRNKCNRISIMS
jgi:hypothetical protein